MGAEHTFAWDTWNTPERIAAHRALAPAERIELAVQVSRAALALARAPRESPALAGAAGPDAAQAPAARADDVLVR